MGAGPGGQPRQRGGRGGPRHPEGREDAVRDAHLLQALPGHRHQRAPRHRGQELRRRPELPAGDRGRPRREPEDPAPRHPRQRSRALRQRHARVGAPGRRHRAGARALALPGFPGFHGRRQAGAAGGQRRNKRARERGRGRRRGRRRRRRRRDAAHEPAHAAGDHGGPGAPPGDARVADRGERRRQPAGCLQAQRLARLLPRDARGRARGRQRRGARDPELPGEHVQILPAEPHVPGQGGGGAHPRLPRQYQRQHRPPDGGRAGGVRHHAGPAALRCAEGDAAHAQLHPPHEPHRADAAERAGGGRLAHPRGVPAALRRGAARLSGAHGAGAQRGPAGRQRREALQRHLQRRGHLPHELLHLGGAHPRGGGDAARAALAGRHARRREEPRRRGALVWCRAGRDPAAAPGGGGLPQPARAGPHGPGIRPRGAGHCAGRRGRGHRPLHVPDAERRGRAGRRGGLQCGALHHLRGRLRAHHGPGREERGEDRHDEARRRGLRGHLGHGHGRCESV
mmetsp:Transcript_8875/g.25796  ORF Transcript_8875/g.25796 Transcript_8875/m.25796 type:complete len:512 (-) Transcript_8875:118-1653(-)